MDPKTHSSAWNSLFDDTLAPWLSSRSDAAFLEKHEGVRMDGGALVLFFTLQDPFEESENTIQARAILNHFRQHTAERLACPVNTLCDVFNSTGVVVHSHEFVNYSGLQVIMESYSRVGQALSGGAPSQILPQFVYSKREAQHKMSALRHSLAKKTITGDTPQPGLDKFAHGAFFDVAETLKITTEPEAYFHRVFEVEPLLRKKPMHTDRRPAL